MKTSLTLSLFALCFLTACTTSRFEGGSAAPVLERQMPITPPNMYQQNPKADLEDPAPRPTQPVNPVNPIRSEALPETSKPIVPPSPLPVVKPPSQTVAGIDPNTPTPPQPSRPSLGPIGTWSVSEADSKCRITLSSQVSLDRSKANSNCKTPSLARVNAWERRGNEVVLYEGEKVTARLFDKGNGQYEGSTARGAPVSMSR